MYTTFPTNTGKNLLCSWNGQNNQNKYIRNISSVDIVISRYPWYHLFRQHVPLACSCEWTAPDFVPITRRCEISLLVATRDSYNMHERTHLHNLQSLAGCELIQCFYQSRFQWNARLKEKKNLNNQSKVSLPKIYFQTG